MAKICLDAGHYGDYNKSPADGRYYEARAMWKLHRLLAKELTEKGFEIIFTRAEQKADLALTERGRRAEGCDLFLSLHSNAVGDGVNENIDYPVSYVSVSGYADEIGLALAQTVERVMGTGQKARIEKRNGSSGDYYGVLRGAARVGTAGVILEHSFHTNTAMTRWLLDENNLRKLAKAEAEVLAEHYGFGMEDYPSVTEGDSLPDKGSQGTKGEDEIEMPRYKYLEDIPDNWDREGNPRATIEKLMDAGFLGGDGSDPEGNGDVIDLSHDMVRLLVIFYRGGAFGEI